jgi:hypothetical protein
VRKEGKQGKPMHSLVKAVRNKKFTLKVKHIYTEGIWNLDLKQKKAIGTFKQKGDMSRINSYYLYSRYTTY